MKNNKQEKVLTLSLRTLRSDETCNIVIFSSQPKKTLSCSSLFEAELWRSNCVIPNSLLHMLV